MEMRLLCNGTRGKTKQILQCVISNGELKPTINFPLLGEGIKTELRAALTTYSSRLARPNRVDGFCLFVWNKRQKYYCAVNSSCSTVVNKKTSLPRPLVFRTAGEWGLTITKGLVLHHGFPSSCPPFEEHHTSATWSPWLESGNSTGRPGELSYLLFPPGAETSRAVLMIHFSTNWARIEGKQY